MIMNVLSLFDGISTGYLALKDLNININNYYASEIDKYSEAVSKYNFPDIIRLGNIKQWKEWNIDFSSIDLILGGFSCQSWSMAGKQLGDKDPRGQLIYDLIDIWNEVKKYNPNVKFLFENVKMKKEFLYYINDLFKVEPVLIDSSLVSAQSRKRYYWTNIGDIKQPKDRGIILNDIIEFDFIDKYNLYCIDKTYYENNNIKSCSSGDNKQSISNPKRIAIINNGSQGQRIYSTEYKGITLSANGGGIGAKTGLYAVAQRGRYVDNNSKTEQILETSFSNKSNCLTSVQKDSLLMSIRNKEIIIRKLLPLECERLQTLPDNYTAFGIFPSTIKEKKETGKDFLPKKISDNQRYKMLGNGWTLEVIKHILSYL